MSSEFTDLSEFLDPSLRLPVRGKTYVVPPISYEDGLWAQATMNVAVQVVANERSDDPKPLKSPAILDDDEERDLYERMLGPALAEMRADRLSWPEIQRCGTTAYLYWVAGKDAALKFWREGRGKHRARIGRRAAGNWSRPGRPRDGPPPGLRARRAGNAKLGDVAGCARPLG